MALSIHEDAVVEVSDATVWYDQQRVGLGVEFADVILGALAEIERNPMRWTVDAAGLRRYVVARFPYTIIYRVTADADIRVVAFAHHKRRPGYWRQRR